MATATDFFTNAAGLWTGTVGSGGFTSGSTTLPLSSTTGLTNGEVYYATVDRVDANGTSTPSKRTVYKGLLSGANLINCSVVEGSDQDHAAGKVVEILFTAAQWNDLTSGLEVEHNADGTHKTLAYIPTSYLDTSTTLSANSDTKVPSQKAVKSYVDTATAATGDWKQYSTVTPTTGSFDSPSFPIVFSGVDLTGTLQAGMRVKITQTTTKYFIITKVAFSTDTTVTLYGGTDYSLVASGTTAISAFYYSSLKAPFGFPMEPIKWTQTTTNTSNNTQTSPTAATWYNTGTITLDVPIGAWRLSYRSYIDCFKNSSTSIDVYMTLSTANNSESDTTMTTYQAIQGASGTLQITTTTTQQKDIVVSSKTTYYLIHKTGTASLGNMAIRGDVTPTVIRAVCSYL